MCFFFLIYFPPIYTVLFKESWAEIFLPWIFSAVIKLSVEEIWTQFGRNKDRVFWYIGPQLSIAWKGRRGDFFLGSCKIVTYTDFMMYVISRLKISCGSKLLFYRPNCSCFCKGQMLDWLQWKKQLDKKGNW